MTVTVPAARCEKAYSTTLAMLKRDYKVPGFRNNEKVPADMLIQACGGEAPFFTACVEEVLHSTLEEAFSTLSESILDGSLKVESDSDELVSNYRRDAPLTYVVTAEVGELGLAYAAPYTGMDIAVDAVLNQSEEDRRVDKALMRLLREKGGDLRVAQRGVQRSDSVIIDFAVRDKASKEEVQGLKRERHELETDDEENFLPGVIPQMLGMRVGEQRIFEFAFPDKWEPAQLAGMQCEVVVKLREVLEWIVPELTLDVCRSAVPGESYNTVDEFKQRVREAVVYEASEELQARTQSAILSRLSEITTVQRIPEEPFRQFALGRYQQKLEEAITAGGLEKEQVEELAQEATFNVFFERERGMLESEFSVTLALDDIFQKEGLSVDDELVEEQTLSLYEAASKTQKDLQVEDVREHVLSDMRNMSTVAFLQEKAQITIRPLLE